MTTELTVGRRAVLRALADQLVPSLARDEDPTASGPRAAATSAPTPGSPRRCSRCRRSSCAGVLALLDGLHVLGFATASERSREQLLRNVSLMGAAPAAGMSALSALTLAFAYAAPDPRTGLNPTWEAFGYPGPAAHRAAGGAEPLATFTPQDDGRRVRRGRRRLGRRRRPDRRRAGPGRARRGRARGRRQPQRGRLHRAGAAGLPAAVLARRADADRGLQRHPARRLDARRRADGQLVQLPAHAATRCASSGRASPAWTASTAPTSTVTSTRSGAGSASTIAARTSTARTSGCATARRRSDWSFKTRQPQRRPGALLARLGRPHRLRRPLRRQARRAPHLPARRRRRGRPRDRRLPRRARAALDGGVAAGVPSRLARLDAASARRVVVACGSLESPALLLRSGIGGPAVGRNLHLHPTTAFLGLYPEEQRPWLGAPMSALVDEFADVEDGHGFLIEGAQWAPSIIAGGIGARVGPRAQGDDGAARQRGLADRAAARPRARHGDASTTPATPSCATRSTTPIDVRVAHAVDRRPDPHPRGRGRRRDRPVRRRRRRWRRGDDLEAFIAAMQRVPLGAGGFRLFSAHQMSSCRMGDDPTTSVANPCGELHDTPGVYIGDASALPTASRRQPDDLDHGARAPHRGGDRRRGDARVRRRREETRCPSPFQCYDRLYVGGEWIAPATAETIDVVNPYTEEAIGRDPRRRRRRRRSRRRRRARGVRGLGGHAARRARRVPAARDRRAAQRARRRARRDDQRRARHAVGLRA